MSRTLRRRKLRHSYRSLGYLKTPEEDWKGWCWFLGGPAPENYADYKKLWVSCWHRDSGKYHANYSSAPWTYRNIRRRQFRREVKKGLRKCLTENPEFVLIPHKPRSASWDYW